MNHLLLTGVYKDGNLVVKMGKALEYTKDGPLEYEKKFLETGPLDHERFFKFRIKVEEEQGL